MVDTALEVREAGALERPHRLPPIPWRDPHSVDPQQLAEYIAVLEKNCAAEPDNAGLRTCLGMAHAMNYDVYKSMDALEEARRIEPDYFFAQFKYSELYFRLRALDRAEEETKRALELAGNGWELANARKMLQEIRRLKRDGTQKPAWTKPLTAPVLVLLGMLAASGLLVFLR